MSKGRFYGWNIPPIPDSMAERGWEEPAYKPATHYRRRVPWHDEMCAWTAAQGRKLTCCEDRRDPFPHDFGTMESAGCVVRIDDREELTAAIYFEHGDEDNLDARLDEIHHALWGRIRLRVWGNCPHGSIAIREYGMVCRQCGEKIADGDWYPKEEQ